MTSDQTSQGRPLALVTGASSGIGRVYAERLAADGFDLVVIARRADRLDELKGRLEAAGPASVRVLALDLATSAGRREADVAASDPRLEMVVDGAALAHYMPFLQLPASSLEELVNLNVLAPVSLIRAALPGMVERGRGTVVSFASLLAFSGASENPQLPRRAVYAASKAFLVAFFEILSAELRGTGVRVQIVCPGIVRTEFHTRQGMDMSDRPRLEPEQIVSASLAGLQLGEVVCVPTLEDSEVIARHRQTAAEIVSGGMRPLLGQRYLREG